MVLKLLFPFTLLLNVSIAYYLNNEFERISSPKQLANTLGNYVKLHQNYSNTCLPQISHYAESLRARKTWALKMFDATSKLPSGFYSGNQADLGVYDQCLEIIEKDTAVGEISGKYCLGSVSLSLLPTNHTNIASRNDFSSTIRWSICFPEGCSADDIQQILNQNGLLYFNFSEDACQTQKSQPELSGGDIALLSVFGIFGLLVIISTLYEAHLALKKKRSRHRLFLAFSIISNAKAIFENKEEDKSRLSCLRGIRAVSMLWVMLGHRYLLMVSLPLRNSTEISKWLENKMTMFIINSTLSADTFLLVSGTLVSYGFLRANKIGIKFNIFKYYIHRYLRLTPVLAVVVAVHLTLFRHLGSGPIWPEISKSQFIDSCQDYWWTTLLYVQNYVNPTAVCVPESWYLAINSQLFLLSPLILVPLQKWPTLTLYLVGALTVSSILACFLVGWFYEINALWINNANSQDMKDFLGLYYMTTHTRASPWLIGIFVGYFVYRCKYENKARPRKWFILVCWFLALSVLLTCVFSGESFVQNEYNRVGNSLHLALVRPSWGLAVGWVVFACSCGFGGIVNTLLSLEPFDLLSKLSYGIYLIHYTEMAVVSAGARASITFADVDANIVLGGDVPVSLVLSLVLTLVFESPILTIEKYIFQRN